MKNVEKTTTLTKAPVALLGGFLLLSSLLFGCIDNDDDSTSSVPVKQGEGALVLDNRTVDNFNVVITGTPTLTSNVVVNSISSSSVVTNSTSSTEPPDLSTVTTQIPVTNVTFETIAAQTFNTTVNEISEEIIALPADTYSVILTQQNGPRAGTASLTIADGRTTRLRIFRNTSDATALELTVISN